MRYFIFLLAAILLVSCSGTPAQSPEVPQSIVPTPVNLPLPAASPTPDAVYEIFASVDRPEPKPDEVVTVSASLVKNGVYLGSIPMWFFWPDEKGGSVPHSFVNHMAYQRGICAIYAKDFPVDVFVPISIRVEYQGRVFTTETGFTPRAK